MRIADSIKHPEERFPKVPIAFRGRSDLTHTAFVAEQTIDFIHQHRDTPFLCISGFYSPHSPWVAPQEFLDRYDSANLTLPQFPPEVDAKRSDALCSDEELRLARQGYYGMISEVDHHIGRILDTLNDLRLAEDTVVVFTSDHGEWLGEHLRYGKGYPGPDCVSRVPLLIRWPQRSGSAGQKVHQIVEAVDVAPTLLECAGVPVPDHLQGYSLLPLAHGVDGPQKPALMEMRGWKSLRTDEFRYVSEANGKESLYDLTKDPGEYHNVAADASYATALSDLRRQLLQRLIEMERPIPRIWTY